MSKVLEKYIPQAAIPIVQHWFYETKTHLTIKAPRMTKFGDFRPSFKGKPHRISVNGDLNPYHFLITLTHEFAHVYTWMKYKQSVPPHGMEWKNTYAKMLKQLIDLNCFPEILEEVLIKHLNNPRASSVSDAILFKTLRSLDDKETLSLDQVEEGAIFQFRNRKFKKGIKRRVRYECMDLSNGKVYLINGQANIEN